MKGKDVIEVEKEEEEGGGGKGVPPPYNQDMYGKDDHSEEKLEEDTTALESFKACIPSYKR